MWESLVEARTAPRSHLCTKLRFNSVMHEHMQNRVATEALKLVSFFFSSNFLVSCFVCWLISSETVGSGPSHGAQTARTMQVEALSRLSRSGTRRRTSACRHWTDTQGTWPSSLTPVCFQTCSVHWLLRTLQTCLECFLQSRWSASCQWKLGRLGQSLGDVDWHSRRWAGTDVKSCPSHGTTTAPSLTPSAVMKQSGYGL